MEVFFLSCNRVGCWLSELLDTVTDGVFHAIKSNCIIMYDITLWFDNYRNNNNNKKKKRGYFGANIYIFSLYITFDGLDGPAVATRTDLRSYIT